MFVSASLLVFSWVVFLFIGLLVGAWIILEVAQ